MNRRRFFSGLGGIAAAISVVPAFAKSEALRKALPYMPRRPVTGQIVMLVYDGNNWLRVSPWHSDHSSSAALDSSTKEKP